MTAPISAVDQGWKGSQGWTVDQAAEDVLAQLEELAAEGATTHDLTLALEREGLDEATAKSLVLAAVRHDAPGKAGEEAAFGIDLSEFRQLLRKGTPQTRLDLTAALLQRGVPAETAQAVVHQVADADGAVATSQNNRLRRLGIQGMVAGSLFATFFSLAASTGQEGAKIHWVTVAVCLGLSGYSYILWRRHR